MVEKIISFVDRIPPHFFPGATLRVAFSHQVNNGSALLSATPFGILCQENVKNQPNLVASHQTDSTSLRSLDLGRVRLHYIQHTFICPGDQPEVLHFDFELLLLDFLDLNQMKDT